MTKEIHPVHFDKFRKHLFDNKKTDEIFELSQLQTEFDSDNNNLQTGDALQYIEKMVLFGELVGVTAYKRTGIKLTEEEQNEKLQSLKTGQKEPEKKPEEKEERLQFIEYEGFSSIVLKHWLKGEIITAYRVGIYLNHLNIFLPYELLRGYMIVMVNKGKLIHYKGKKYQKIV